MFLLVVVIGLAFLLFRLFEPFLLSLFVAVLLAVSTSSIKDMLFVKIKSKTVVSLIMTVAIFVLFFSPVLYFLLKLLSMLEQIDEDRLTIVYNQVYFLISDINNNYSIFTQNIKQIIANIDIKSIIKNIISFISYMGIGSVGFIMNLILVVVFYTIFNFYSQEIVSYIKTVLPLEQIEKKELFSKLSNTMGVVFYSIISTAIFEGFLFGAFVSMFGYDGLMFGILYGFASLIPVVGGIIMWLPLAILQLIDGNIQNAIYISLYTIIVISIIADTIIKPLIIKYINQNIVENPTNINELVVFFSIVAGLGAFGFWGMIIGPAIVAAFLMVLDISKKRI